MDSSSLFPQSLSPSQSQRLGMQRLFLHLKRSEGQVCWSVGEKHTQDPPLIPPHPSSTSKEEKNWDRKGLEPQTWHQNLNCPPIPAPLLELERGQRAPGCLTLPQPLPPHLGEPQPQPHRAGGVTHGRARGLRRCCPGSRCPRRTSSAPGCSGCSCRRTRRAGTAAGGCTTGWLPRGKHRQDFKQVTKCSFPWGKGVPTRVPAYPGR